MTNTPRVAAMQRDADRAVAPAQSLFWLALTALVVCVATVVGMTAYSRNMERWVEHTTIVYQTTRSGLLDLTGLVPGSPAAAAATNPERAIARFDSVGDLTADNALQQARMRSIRELAGQWATAVRAGAPVAPGLADAVEAKVRQFLAEEQRLYQVRSNRFHAAQTATAITAAIELAFVALLVIEYSRRIARHIALASEQQEQLEEQAAELEEQAMELEVSNHELRGALTRVEVERESATTHERRGERTAALLNASLDSAPVAFALVDQDLRYVQVNTRWAELSGVSAEQHIGRRFDDVPFSKDALAPALDVVARIGADSTSPVNVPLSGHRAADGDTDLRHWLLSASPVSETQGSTGGGVAIALLDVSDHARTTNQLLHVQKMEAIGRLAGGIAHDFNNSLAVINAYASMLALSQNLDGTDHSRVDEIIEAVQRAAGLTQQLLAFGRRQITQPRRIDASDVVRGMVPVLTRLIPASIQLETRIGDGDEQVLIDTSQLEQIVLNLVNNAIHAMPDGGHLTIASERVDLDEAYAGRHMNVIPGPYVMFTISDTGTGMDAATMNRIFEPFFTTKEAGKGTGLGLASVYAIVKDAGGHTWVYSEPGKGTEFKVYLPIVSGVAPTVEERSETHVLQRDDFAKLLLVEDDEKLRPAVARLLEQAGYTIVEAANGDSALARLREHGDTFDLVITDLVMPGLSGRELSEIISDRYPTLRVLFTSGYTDDGVVRRGMIERGYPFIQKPFTRDQLLGAIDQALTAA